MRYLSVFFAVLFVWIALVLAAWLVLDTDGAYRLYLYVLGFTVLLFLLGFLRK